MSSRSRKLIYLFFLIFGSMVPMIISIPHLKLYGISPIAFLKEASATPLSTAVFADVCLGLIVFLIFCYFDIKKRGAPMWELVVTILLIPVGIVASLAFYFYRRELISKPGEI